MSNEDRSRSISDIARGITTEYNLTIEDLKAKRYRSQPDIADMKTVFMGRCMRAGFSAKEIADYLDYHLNSVYKLVDYKPPKKYELVLQDLQEDGYVDNDAYYNIADTITILRDKGYNIYFKDGKYYLS